MADVRMAKKSKLYGLIAMKARRKKIETTEFPDAMTVGQFLEVIMYEMKEVGLLDDIISQALEENIDPETVDDLPPEGILYCMIFPIISFYL